MARFFCSPSMAKNRTVSSMPMTPPASFFAFSQSATSAAGFSSSCQTLISPGTPSISRIDGSSNPGVNTHNSPSAGSTAAVSRSLRHHCTPVK